MFLFKINTPFLKNFITRLIQIINTFILNFKGYFKDLGESYIFNLKIIYTSLKRKYEPNKYMVISQTKISAKTIFCNTNHLHAN